MIILTDADGFVTAIHDVDSLWRESTRLALSAPIQAVEWKAVGFRASPNGYKRVREWTWDGSPPWSPIA